MQHGFFIVNELKLEVNKTILNITSNYSTDRTQETTFNFNFYTFATLNNFRIYFSINLPENKDDVNFRKELVRTVVDYEKIVKGVFGNPIVKIFMEDIFSSMDFEPHLPIKPVRRLFF